MKSFNFPENLEEELRNISYDMKTSQTKIVIMALKEFFEKHKKEDINQSFDNQSYVDWQESESTDILPI